MKHRQSIAVGDFLCFEAVNLMIELNNAFPEARFFTFAGLFSERKDTFLGIYIFHIIREREWCRRFLRREAVPGIALGFPTSPARIEFIKTLAHDGQACR